MNITLRRISGLFAFALGVFCSYTWASPPTDAPPKNAQDAFYKADVVFLGRVENTFKDKYGYDSLATVRVQKVWKGKDILSEIVHIDGSGGPTYPARIFKMSENYLFYLNVAKKGESLRADSYLNRVLLQHGAASDIAYLSEVHKP